MDNQAMKTAIHDTVIRAVTEISGDVKELLQAPPGSPTATATFLPSRPR